MKATKNILSVWRRFDDFPMETLTKAWYNQFDTNKKQREVPLMKEHREQYGITGNCFDLAIWLLDEFQKEGVEAYPIGSDMGSTEAHAAVMAVDEKGQRYLCDLGDQWINPILLDKDSEDFSGEKLRGFFPGAEVQVVPKEEGVEVLYHRPNGKTSNQLYDLTPIKIDEFLEAAEFSQQNIWPHPLLECRKPYKSEIGHWEFYDWESFFSSSEGLQKEKKLETIEEWAIKINQMTGYKFEVVVKSLEIYKTYSNK